jgi:two-component system, NarL family, invasion response regulator UvrY
MEHKIRVIIADDHAVVRTGLQLMFDETDDIVLNDEASNGNELIKKIREKDYDVVILDISMPGKDVIDTLKDIKNLKPGLPVLIFTMNPEDTYAVRLFSKGAAGYISKECDPKILMEAIRTIYKGHKYYTPAQLQLLANSIDNSDKNNSEPHKNLSDREFQVFCLLAEGKKKGEIADILSVSKNTIDNHRNNILNKLKLASNSDITRYALQKRLIQ